MAVRFSIDLSSTNNIADPGRDDPDPDLDEDNPDLPLEKILIPARNTGSISEPRKKKLIQP